MNKVFSNGIFIFLIFLIAIIVINQNKSQPIYPESKKINTILLEIYENYVDSIDINTLVEKSIRQTLINLDPHSTYMDVDEVSSSMQMMQGSFQGVGIEFSIHKDTIIIINVIPNGPSEKRGLKAGERIIMIDDENVASTGINNQDVISKLRGEKGSKVKVGVQNRGDTIIRFVNITRDKIPLTSLDVSYEISDRIGYIKLNRFSATTFEEFTIALKMLKKEHQITSLILDLRGNTGGYLDQAIKILNEFFHKNELLVYTEGNSRKKEEYFADRFGIFKDGNLCVLINEGSASASEIVAGAIQDHGRGLVLGERSFGKGLVQEQILLEDGSLIRLTVSRYYTPSGRCIQKPYSENQEDYFLGTYEQDNNKVVDSLNKFTTTDGRTVYGGGGITPDHIIASKNDSLPTSLVYLYTSTFFNDLAFDYVDSNRNYLTNLKVNKFLISKSEEDFIFGKIKDWIILELGDNKNNKKLSLEIEQYNAHIIERFSALIIRQYWGWEEMQMFFNENDEIISTSLSLFKKQN